MAKKKVEASTIEDTNKAEIKIEGKSIDDVYTGLLVLDMKLTQLIDIFSKVNDYLEKKQKGELGI